ncbi:hypothetical protein C8J56DRAFT_458240 [Mycena floridula]|nr:hypothetical protein C8J56DRAFT_458240 [Mycena floridula]
MSPFSLWSLHFSKSPLGRFGLLFSDLFRLATAIRTSHCRRCRMTDCSFSALASWSLNWDDDKMSQRPISLTNLRAFSHDKFSGQSLSQGATWAEKTRQDRSIRSPGTILGAGLWFKVGHLDVRLLGGMWQNEDMPLLSLDLSLFGPHIWTT